MIRVILKRITDMSPQGIKMINDNFDCIYKLMHELKSDKTKIIKNKIINTVPQSFKAINDNFDYIGEMLTFENGKKSIINSEAQSIKMLNDNFSLLYTPLEVIISVGPKIVPVLEITPDLVGLLRPIQSVSPTDTFGYTTINFPVDNYVYFDRNDTVNVFIKLENLNGKCYCRYGYTEQAGSTFPKADTVGVVIIKDEYYVEVLPVNDKLIYLSIYSNLRLTGYEEEDLSCIILSITNNTDRILYFDIKNDDDTFSRVSKVNVTGIVHQGINVASTPTTIELTNAIPYVGDSERDCNCSTYWKPSLKDYGTAALIRYSGVTELRIKIPMTVDGYNYYKYQQTLPLTFASDSTVCRIYKDSIYYIKNGITKRNISSGAETSIVSSAYGVDDFVVYKDKIFYIERYYNAVYNYDYKIKVYDILLKTTSIEFCLKLVCFALSGGFIYAMKDDTSGNRLLYRYTQSGTEETLVSTLGLSNGMGKEMAIINGILYFCRYTDAASVYWRPGARYDTLRQINLATSIESATNTSTQLNMCGGIIIRNNNWYFTDCSSGVLCGKTNLTTGNTLYTNKNSNNKIYNVIPFSNHIHVATQTDSINRINTVIDSWVRDDTFLI